MNLRRAFLAFLTVTALALAGAPPSVAAPPNDPWVIGDIGSPTPAGSTDVDANGIWTLQGSGGDIWGDTDQFQYARQSIRGDGSISARFLSRQGGDGEWAKVGLMVRENDSPGSPDLYYAMTPGHGLHAGVRFAQDDATGGYPPVGPADNLSGSIGLFLRLQRVGQEIAGFYSRDGTLWTQAGFGPVPLPSLKEEALFGLAVTSHRDGTLTTAKFDQVSMQPGVVSAYGVQACGSDHAVLLQWRPLKNALAFNVYRGPAGATRAQFVRLNADLVAGTSFLDSGSDLVNGTPVLYAVAPVFKGADGNPMEGPVVTVAGTPIAVPSGLMGCGISEGAQPGSAAYDPATGEITLRASGVDIWNNGDQGYFLGQPVEGDFQATVRVLSKNAGAACCIASGLIIRDSLDAGAREMLIGSWATAGLWRQWRDTPDGGTIGFQSLLEGAFKPPLVLRLTRRGNTITPAYSTDDGKTFRLAPAVTFSAPLGRTLYVGLMLASSSRSRATTMRFRDLAIQKL
jgi:regulation of enolase protein 1 (concanavalin A-like superfamily)